MDQKFNYITFDFDPSAPAQLQDDGTSPPSDATPVRIFLKADGEFVWSCGLEPNVNRFLVPFTEFDKLAGKPDRTGTLNFWYSSDPNAAAGSKPDFTLKQMRVIDVAANQVGECKETPGGNSTFRVVEYVLFIADFRESIVPPRGGRLLDGILNAGSDDVLYPTPLATPVNNQQLAMRCLTAMGLDPNDVDNGLTTFPPLRNLQWHGAHAPTELAKVLEHTNSVLAPQTSGKASVVPVGKGDLPNVPQDRKEYQIKLPGIDRRGKTVIFSSAPTAAVDTYQFSGIDQTFGGSSPMVWVKQQGDSSYAQLGNIVTNIQNHSAYPPDAYRAIQIQPSQFDPRVQPILRRALSSDTTPKRSAIRVEATIAVQALNGAWSNQDTIVPVTHILEGNVICLAQRVGQVSVANTGDGDGNFQEVPSSGFGSLSVKITMEAVAPSPSNPMLMVREFFYSGWRRDVGSGSPTRLSDDEVNSALADPPQDLVIIHRPEMRLVRDQTAASNPAIKYSSGEADNSLDLNSRCQQLADRYLRGSGNPAQEIAAKGFLQAELNGRLAEIRIDQAACRTVFKVMTWWLPSGQTGKLYRGEGGYGGSGGHVAGGASATGGKAGGSGGVPGGGAPSGGSTHSLGSGNFPQQDQTDHESLSVGATQARQPSVPASPALPAPGLLPPGGLQYMVLVRPDNNGYVATWDWVRAHA
jgi:hypothetical protein